MLMEWSYLTKHETEEKPPLPYHTGANIPARAWDPPLEDPPDGHAWDNGELDGELQNEHPLETCVRYTGAAGDISFAERVNLKIMDEIRVEDFKHSQIAKVKVLDKRSDRERARLPLPSGKDLTAKFYDPLYQDIEDDRSDIFTNTYANFCRETFIYQQLKPLWGKVVPCFYGSFQAYIPVPGRPGMSRLVNTILYQFVSGTVLSKINASEWSRDERKAIMKGVLDGDSKMRQAGVLQRDLMPRNVILQGQPGHQISIRLIDFDNAYCLFEPEPDAKPEPEPPSDIVNRWMGDAFMYEDAFSDIVDWPWTEWLQEVYLRSGR